jgi:thermolysin
VRRLLSSTAVGALAVIWLFAHAAPSAQARRVTQMMATTSAQAQQFDARIDRMLSDGDLKLQSLTADELLPGRTHERLQQTYQDVPIFGADVTRELDGATVSVLGQVYTGVEVDTAPAISAEQAEAVVGAITGKTAPEPTGRLVILPADDGTFALTWQVRRFTGDDLKVFFIDAHTGTVALEYSDLETQAAIGRGAGVLGDVKKMSASQAGGIYVADDKMRPPKLVTYDLKGDLARTKLLLGDPVGVTIPAADTDRAGDSDNVWTDGDVVDAHTYLGWTYDYYFKRFNRRGLNDQSAAMLGIAHPGRRSDAVQVSQSSPSDFNTYWTNAFWCGGCGAGGASFMMFGEGLPAGYYVSPGGQYVDYLAASLDIVAHELTHGVTGYSSNLVYRDEPGALNEAFSDIIGTSVEFYYQPRAADVVNGSGTMTADYLMGEDSFRAFASGSHSGLRSLANPALFSNPDHYSKRRYIGTATDNGGVHYNSTIVGHAFYLAIEGGTNRTSGLSVQGVGDKNRDQIEKIFYRAFVYNLTSQATFSMARLATIQAARDLYGTGSAPEQAVTQAWNAVGVTSTSSGIVAAAPTEKERPTVGQRGREK